MWEHTRHGMAAIGSEVLPGTEGSLLTRELPWQCQPDGAEETDVLSTSWAGCRSQPGTLSYSNLQLLATTTTSIIVRSEHSELALAASRSNNADLA